jgi:hypothetical protein
MKQFIAFFVLMICCNSCFLFSDLKKRKFSFSENGTKHSINAVVPKKYSKTETRVDSSGNQVHYFIYPGGAELYFAFLKDTTTELQTINYDENIPRQLYQTIFYKGVDSTNHYWRETRFNNYKAGYRKVEEEDNGTFDSAINYFSLHLKR